MTRLVDVIVDIAREVGSFLQKHVLDTSKFGIVSESRDDVTRLIDIEVEKLIIEKLKERNISCIFIGEEHGIVKIGESPEYIVVADPLDGSANYISNIPFYSVSIAAGRYAGQETKLGHLQVGVVNYVPAGTLYIANVENREFKIEGRDIKYEQYPHEKPTFIMYLEPKHVEQMLKFLNLFWSEFPDVRVRIFGAASIEIIETLLRKFMAFIDIRNKLRVVDLAATYVMSRVLGAKMVDVRGVDLGEYTILAMPRFSLIVTHFEDVLTKLLSILSKVE